MTSKAAISEGLNRFINEYADNQDAMQVIMFFAMHPNARFSELAITHALNQCSSRRGLKKAINDLVGRGVISTSNENRVSLYSLPDNTLLKGLILELARLDIQQCWLLALNRPLTNGRIGGEVSVC